MVDRYPKISLLGTNQLFVGAADSVSRVISENHALRTEEDVKVQHLIPFLERHGYPVAHCDFELAVEVQEGRRRKNIFADIVVYADAAKKTPLILCEAKSISEPLTKYVRDQAISYARLLPRIAPLCLITNGIQTQIFQTLSKNRLDSLPGKDTLQGDIVSYTISKDLQEALRAEAKHELFVIDDVETFKNLLKSCHNEIRNNEGVDPTVAFDEMSKLLFCKMHEERKGGKNRFRLSVYDETLLNLGINVVSQIFSETVSDPAYSGLFDPHNKIELQDRTVRKVVQLFENFDLSLTAFDVKGEAFEYFLSDTFTGGLGEYFTPRNVVEFICEAMDPRIGEKIVDPFCGTGGFLMYAFEVVGEKIRIQDFSEDEKTKWRIDLSNKCLFGTDWKERTAQACKMNMVVHGDGSSGIFLHHGLIDVPGVIQEGDFNVCLTNPPFGSFENDPAVLSKYDLGQGRASQDRIILGIERGLKLLRPSGRMGIVVIDGILNNSSTQYVRDYIKLQSKVLGVISLNRETFEGYNARAKTSVLFLEKRITPEFKPNAEETFFAVVNNTGYAPNGAMIPGNQLPDVLNDYKEWIAGRKYSLHRQSKVCVASNRLDAEFYVPKDAISDVDFPKTVGTIINHADLISREARSLGKGTGVTLGINTNVIRLSDILEQSFNKTKVVQETSYNLVGVKWWGGGTFLREQKTGGNLSAKTLYRLAEGALIYNRLFAFRGSFAVVDPAHDGFFVSNEFPNFCLKKSRGDGHDPKLLMKYIVNYMNSPQMLSEVDRLSTGSTPTSRNRFSEARFLELTIKVPVNADALRDIVDQFSTAARLKILASELTENLNTVRNQLGGALFYNGVDPK